jgi:hypothetical protein
MASASTRGALIHRVSWQGAQSQSRKSGEPKIRVSIGSVQQSLKQIGNRVTYKFSSSAKFFDCAAIARETSGRAVPGGITARFKRRRIRGIVLALSVITIAATAIFLAFLPLAKE